MAANFVDDTLNGVPSVGEQLQTTLRVAELILQAATTSGYSNSDSGGSLDTSDGFMHWWMAERAVTRVESGGDWSRKSGKAWTLARKSM